MGRFNSMTSCLLDVVCVGENGRKDSVQREPRKWMSVSCQRVTEQNDNMKRGNEVNYVQHLSCYVTVTIQQTFRQFSDGSSPLCIYNKSN